jgi:osmotically-inducible protein OsmY
MSDDNDDTNRPPDDDYGSRDLRYGHAFGTQRDRSKGEEGYLDTANDVWTSVPSREGLGPEEQEKDDRRIEAEVRERLTDHDRLDASSIQVRVEGGEVALTGTVEDADIRQLAEDALGGITGIKAVYNQLRVQSDETEEPE